MTKVFVCSILALVLVALLATEAEAQWPCADKSKTILYGYVCDKITHCDDGSDESDDECFTCVDDSDKIRHQSTCDQWEDCNDGSDEDLTLCPNQVYCKQKYGSGYAYQLGKVCDGKKDCTHLGEDELNCESVSNDDEDKKIELKPYIQGHRIPEEGKWQCADDEYNEKSDDDRLCDGLSDCNDNSDEDELLCANKWQCVGNNETILDSFVCDDVPDCQDQSDEGETLCKNWNVKIGIISAKASSQKSTNPITKSYKTSSMSQGLNNCWITTNKVGEWANYTLENKAKVRSVEILFYHTSTARNVAKDVIISVCDDVNGAESCLPCGPVGEIPESEKKKPKSVKCWGHVGRNVKVVDPNDKQLMWICNIEIKGTKLED